MKRKNTNNVSPNVSDEEDASSDVEQLTDEDLYSEKELSVVDSNDESDVESDLEDNIKDATPKKTMSEQVKEEIFKRYKERQGKQLYIRFPHKVPETLESLEEKVRELTPLLVKVHKPRQRHVRYCLVDFATKEDRDTALNQLKKSIKKGILQKYVVNIPRTESSDFVKELAERKMKSIENKKAKLRLKKASKKSAKENHFTSTIIVMNLPKTTSVLQIREIFENAVDINIKGKQNKGKSIAAITLPSTMDARNAVKKKISLGGNQLIIKFDNQKMKKNRKRKILQEEKR